MTKSNLLQEAIDFIERGKPDKAREILARLLRIDNNNPEYWLWMSSVVISTNEKIICLKNVIRLDPENKNAQRGLALLEGTPPTNFEPIPFVRRKWGVDYTKNIESDSLIKRIYKSGVFRGLIFLAALVIVAGLISFGILESRGGFRPQLTITPIPWTLTPTQTFTATPLGPSITPRMTSTPIPFLLLLEATYTPIPPYVNTPHPRLEAFRLAMRAYEMGDYEGMAEFLLQTLEDEPDAADLHYYLGEAYRHLGDYEESLKHFENALEIDFNFGPVYLSRALLRKSLNPNIDMLSDLNNAVNRDPMFGEAYLERAKYWFSHHEYQKALDDLNAAMEIIPTYPELYVEFARVYLATDQREDALITALEAHQRDITNSQSYVALVKAYLANDMLDEAMEKNEAYGFYFGLDASYYALLGGIQFEMGEDYETALTTLNDAISLDDDLAIAYFYRGLTNLLLENSRQAVNDIYVSQSLEPRNVEYAIWFGAALYEEGRYREAYGLLNTNEPQVKSSKLRAIFYYYKGKAGIELAQYDPVKNAWLELLNLPAEMVPSEWILEAEEYLNPPTETLELTNIGSPSVTLTATTSPTVQDIEIATPTP